MINRRGFLRLAAALASSLSLNWFPTEVEIIQPLDTNDEEDFSPVDAQLVVHDGKPSMYLLGPDRTILVSHNFWDDGIEWHEVCTCPEQSAPVSTFAVCDDAIYVGYEDITELYRYTRATGEWEKVNWQIAVLAQGM